MGEVNGDAGASPNVERLLPGGQQAAFSQCRSSVGMVEAPESGRDLREGNQLVGAGK